MLQTNNYQIFFDMIQTNGFSLRVITALWQNLQLDFDSLDLKRKLKQISNDCGIVASIFEGHFIYILDSSNSSSITF